MDGALKIEHGHSTRQDRGAACSPADHLLASVIVGHEQNDMAKPLGLRPQDVLVLCWLEEKIGGGGRRFVDRQKEEEQRVGREREQKGWLDIYRLRCEDGLCNERAENAERRRIEGRST